MKLGIVYTSTTPELIECVNEEIRKNLGDTPEILNYQDPSILAEVRDLKAKEYSKRIIGKEE